MGVAAKQIDLVFRALSDPTRRSVLERLGKGEATVGELAAPFEMALPSFLEHLAMLERSGLVVSRKEGRVRIYALLPHGTREAEDWLTKQRRLWSRRLDQLADYLLKMKGEEGCKRRE